MQKKRENSNGIPSSQRKQAEADCKFGLLDSFQGKYHHDENLVQERVSKTNQKSKNLKEIYFRNIVLIFQVFLSISAKVEKILLRSQFDEKHGC